MGSKRWVNRLWYDEGRKETGEKLGYVCNARILGAGHPTPIQSSYRCEHSSDCERLPFNILGCIYNVEVPAPNSLVPTDMLPHNDQKVPAVI